MAIRVIVHVLNEDAVLAEIDKLPDPRDNCLVAYNPRKRDGKPLPLLADGVTSVIYPWTRVTYVEILDESGGIASGERVVGFFRESNTNHG